MPMKMSSDERRGNDLAAVRYIEEAIFFEDEGDNAVERDLMNYNHKFGRLHVVLDGGKLASVNVRDGLLKAAPTMESATYSIAPFDLNIEVTKFVVNRTETIGVLAGKTLGDADTVTVRVLYLGSRDITNREVPSADLDPSLFGTYPGLEILDLQFHPDSEHHIVILTSDRTLRVYNLEEARCGLPAEQTFELRGRKRVFLDDEADDDDDGWDEVLRDPVPVAFAFGRTSSSGRDGSSASSPMSFLTSSSPWTRLTVLVLMSDGQLRPLCPIAPFGARYSGRFIASLLADHFEDVDERTDSLRSSSPAGSKRELAQIWTFKAFGVDDWRNVEEQRKYVVAPHALESHVPKFSERGVRVRSNGPEDSALSFESQFRSIHVWNILPSMMAVLETTAGGLLRAGILVGDVFPVWTMNPPQCVFHGDDIVAVRSQCVQQNLFSSNKQTESEHEGLIHVVIDDIAFEKQPIIGLFRDPTNPTSFVVAQQLAAHAVSLPWISSLHEELPDVLPMPSVTELMRTERSRPAVCHALLGDKLSGSALFSILSDGTQLIHKIVARIGGLTGYGLSGALGVASNVESSSHSDTGGKQSAVLANHVKELYKSILSAPNVTPRSFSSTEPADSPNNLEAFVDSINDLRSQPVAFCHKAHHTIRQQVQHLEAEVQDQLTLVKEITTLLHQVEKKQNDLQFLQEKTQWMSTNVADRVQLLGELYWAMPRPKSEEEKRFQHVELPMLESSTAILEKEVNGLCSLAAKLKEGAATAGTRGSGPEQGSAAVKQRDRLRMADLRHVREKLEEHQEAIRREGGRLQAIEKAVRIHGGSRVVL